MRGSIADAATLAAEVERLEVELDALRAIPGGDTEIYVLDDGSHVTGNRAAELLDDEKARSERAIGEREEQRQRTEAAEAELKRWHLLHAWGGTPEIVDAFIKGQQTRIHEAQGVEEALTKAEARVKELEAECLEAKCYMVQHARERGREMQRAEAAEARVKELELKLMRQDEVAREAYEAAIWKYGQERMELESQNARLRATLEDVSLLAHCISKAGPLNTPDLETAWRKFDLISVKAAEALVDRKAAPSGEEATHCADCDWTFPCWQTGAGCRKRPQGEEAST